VGRRRHARRLTGAGFVGSEPADALVEHGHRVRVLDSVHPGAHAGRARYLHPGAEVVVGDVRDDLLLLCALESSHLAAAAAPGSAGRNGV